MKYFNNKELRCACCKENKCTEMFLERLEALRIVFKHPMKVNCAYRCADHNEEVGGSTNSYHLKGEAADIHCPNGKYKSKLVMMALQQGLSVGVYKTFIHLDIREEQTLFWGKY